MRKRNAMTFKGHFSPQSLPGLDDGHRADDIPTTAETLQTHIPLTPSQGMTFVWWGFTPCHHLRSVDPVTELTERRLVGIV